MKHKLLFSLQKMVVLVILFVCFMLAIEGEPHSLSYIKKIPKKELRQIENFFHYLIWNEQALFGYTLFGEKPLSVTYFPNEFPKQLKTIKHPIIHLPKWYSAWEKYQHLFEMKKFVLFSYKGPLAVEIYLLNRDSAARKIQDNLAIFQKELKIDKSPEKILEQLLFSQNFFKEGLNSSHVLFGILLGYGTENSIGFDHYNFEAGTNPPKFFDQPVTCCHCFMPLPFFTVFSEKETNDLLQSYSLQRKKIMQAYSKKPFLKVTFQQLTTPGQMT